MQMYLIFHRLQSEKAHALDMLHESMRQKDHHHHSDLQTLLGEIQAMRADVCICVYCSIIKTLTIIRESVFNLCQYGLQYSFRFCDVCA